MPLTYEKSIEELKKKDFLCKKLYEELNKENNEKLNIIEQAKEKERLECKIKLIQNELNIENVKCEYY